MLGLIAIVKESEEPRNTDQIKRLDMLNKSVVRLDAFIEDILYSTQYTNGCNQRRAEFRAYRGNKKQP
jgi:hypothetical protein